MSCMVMRSFFWAFNSGNSHNAATMTAKKKYMRLYELPFKSILKHTPSHRRLFVGACKPVWMWYILRNACFCDICQHNNERWRWNETTPIECMNEMNVKSFNQQTFVRSKYKREPRRIFSFARRFLSMDYSKVDRYKTNLDAEYASTMGGQLKKKWNKK